MKRRSRCIRSLDVDGVRASARNGATGAPAQSASESERRSVEPVRRDARGSGLGENVLRGRGESDDRARARPRDRRRCAAGNAGTAMRAAAFIVGGGMVVLVRAIVRVRVVAAAGVFVMAKHHALARRHRSHALSRHNDGQQQDGQYAEKGLSHSGAIVRQASNASRCAGSTHGALLASLKALSSLSR